MTQSLHTRTLGSGPDIVLLHGWGAQGSLWNEIATDLATRYRVTVIDLPGHGKSPEPERESEPTLASLTARVAQAAPARAIWLGWSLGGMVAMQLASNAPQRVNKLLLVATTPQFVQSNDWPHAMEKETFNRFAAEMKKDDAATRQRFLMLQTQGSQHHRKTLRQLRHHSSEIAGADAERSGLDILRSVNLRPALASIDCPTQLLHGEQDALVPLAAARAMETMLPGATLQTFPDAGHVPFLSHPQRFLAELNRFCQ